MNSSEENEVVTSGHEDLLKSLADTVVTLRYGDDSIEPTRKARASWYMASSTMGFVIEGSGIHIQRVPPQRIRIYSGSNEIVVSISL